MATAPSKAFEAPNPMEPHAVDLLLEDVELFAAIDNIYWGLWAVNQAKAEGSAEFPYLLYGVNRLERGLCDGGFL